MRINFDDDHKPMFFKLNSRLIKKQLSTNSYFEQADKNKKTIAYTK